MFSVDRFDPRKEDARKRNVKIEKKKKAKLRNPDVKKKKRKMHAKIDHSRETEKRRSSAPMRREVSNSNSVAKICEEKIEVNKESSVNTPGVKNPVSTEKQVEMEARPEAGASLRIIAPETHGAVSTKKNLIGKITAEAFDDLDLTDDAWLTSSSKKQRLTEETKIIDENDESQQSLPTFDPSDETERALEMTRLPIAEAARRWGMADFLVRNLRSNGYEHFFPIQALVIPDVIVAERHMTSLRVRDVCCAAPTGSGKTLAFVLPILNALATRRIRRLRALVILPSRDLAQQVHQVFNEYSKGSGNDLRVGLAIGQTDFKVEQLKLILGDYGKDVRKFNIEGKKMTQFRHLMDPGNLHLSLERIGKELKEGNSYGIGVQSKRWKAIKGEIPAGGISAVDILVCTPGRLVDHLDNTPGFTLQHLRWLIIDEADRLLSQSYHGWIQRVLDSVHGTQTYSKRNNENNNSDNVAIAIDPVTRRRSEEDAYPSSLSSLTMTCDKMPSTAIETSTEICQRIQLRKLLYSATLTKDPQKLSSLRLVNPKYFNAHDIKRRQTANKGDTKTNKLEGSVYRMPEQLRECTVECTAEQKPLVLLALLLERLNVYRQQEESAYASSEMSRKSTIVVFASSLESTHRLTRLLQLLWQTAGYYGSPPVEFSSALNQYQRSLLMKRCNDPNDRTVSVLVCSDGMSRGMDLASCRVVIHYDVPGMAKTYVHRCGRTARAGQDGLAIALLKGKGQAGQFFRLRRLIASPERVTKASVKTSLVRQIIPLYRKCVSRLREVLAAEERNELKSTDPDLTLWLPGNENDKKEDPSDIDSSDKSLE